MHCSLLFLNTIYKERSDTMAFKLNMERKETENKTVRFPVKLITQIEKILSGTQLTFSSFVIQACQYALDNMEKPLPTKTKAKTKSKK